MLNDSVAKYAASQAKQRINAVQKEIQTRKKVRGFAFRLERG